MQPPKETSDYFIRELIQGRMKLEDVAKSINDAIRQSQPQQQPQQQPQGYTQDFSDVQTPTIIESSSLLVPSAPPATPSIITKIEERDRNMELNPPTPPQPSWQQQQQQEFLGYAARQPSPTTGMNTGYTAYAAPQMPPPAAPAPNPASGGASGPTGLRLDQVTEYVDALFEKYAGSVKNADVVHRRRIIKEIMAGKLSVKLAELEVKMRPESKRYMAEQEKLRKEEEKNKAHMSRCREYVMLLAQKYTPSDMPSSEEVEELVMDLCQGTKTYQDVEDLFYYEGSEHVPYSVQIEIT